MTTPSPETLLVDHLVAQAAQGLSAPTRERLAQALLDWFTAGWSGAQMPLADRYRQLAQEAFGAGGSAPVFGGGSLGALGAGFCNAGIAHLREIDDAHRAAMLHPGVVALTPVLALAATRKISRRQALDAIVAGYETVLRLGECLGGGHAGLFHATGTAGAVGAAAAAGMAIGLTREALHRALGHAATQSAGLWQLMDDEAQEAKSLHPGFAVRNGMMAAWAAQAGLPAARDFVTGPRGLYKLLAGSGPIEALHTGLDAPPRLHTTTIKAWPSCAMTFTPLDALQALRVEHSLQLDDVAAIDVRIFSHALKIAGVDWPSKPSETPFCLRYLLAALVRYGRLGIEETERPDLDDPALRALGARVRVTACEEFQVQFPSRRPALVTVRLTDGRELSARRDLRRGDPEDPFDWEQLCERMRAFAPAMGDANAAEITVWCRQVTDPAGDALPFVPAPVLFGRA